MKISSILAITASLLCLATVPSSHAGLQVGGGVNYLNPTDGDENADDDLIGANLEIGLFAEGSVVDSFFGLHGLISGDENDNFGSDTESDYLAGMALYRAMFKLSDSVPVRLYGEGGIGLSRTEVTVASLGDSEFNVDDYGLGYSLGFGVEFALTEFFAIDLGYNFLGMTDVRVLNSDYGGNFHSFRLNAVLRF